jgi:hypothetical protein
VLADHHAAIALLSKTLQVFGREKSRRSYRRWLKGFLTFVFRAWRMEPDKHLSLAGIRLSQKQSGRLQSIWEHPLWDFQISLYTGSQVLICFISREDV